VIQEKLLREQEVNTSTSSSAVRFFAITTTAMGKPPELISCKMYMLKGSATPHMLLPKLTNEILAAAIEGFEVAKARIDVQIGELRTMLFGGSAETAVTPEGPPRKRRKMSAAGRRAIAEAQRKRWAASRKQSAAPSKSATPEAPKKRKLSAAGRRAIIAATKKRWAAVRAAKENADKTKSGVGKRQAT
jgi:hypothetical protein